MLKHQNLPTPILASNYFLQLEAARLIMKNLEEELLEAGFTRVGPDSFLAPESGKVED